jgi:WS/DGAT/MGAT family acyltransferase
MAKRLSPSDMIFLYSESREVMNHVGGLLPFTPPEDAPPDWMRSLVDEIRQDRKLFPPWNLKLKNPDFIRAPVQHWVEDDHIDIDYHVRRSALPSPGDERELGVLVSRLHGNPIDFHYPPWETHFIERLEGGRFAIYTKMHHALIDGFTGMRLLQKSLSTDPSVRDTPLFFAQHHPMKVKAAAAEGDSGPWAVVREQLDAARDVGNVLRDLWRSVRDREEDVVGPLQAPKCILNGRIGKNRRFATQRYSLEHVKALAKAAGGTLNDIVLALCAGTLRRFLMELRELPDRPLVAMIPVNIRPRDDPGGGNAVGSILASLATDIDDPMKRLDAIMNSTRRAKEQLQGLSRSAILQYSAVMLLPSGLQHLTGTGGRVRPQFNVVISNVPGPEQPLYFRGARLEAVYPLSIPIHGQALNITCQSYAGTLDFGFTGCRDTLPRMQRLAVYMGETLNQLSVALNVQP